MRRLPAPSPRSARGSGASASQEVRPANCCRSRGESRRCFCASVNASAPPQKTGWPCVAAAQPLVAGGPGPCPASRSPASASRLSARGHGKVVEPLQAQLRLPGRVPAEQLVGAFAHLADDHAVVAGELRDVVDRHADRVGDRLVLQLHHPRQEVEEVVLTSAGARGARRRPARAIRRA